MPKSYLSLPEFDFEKFYLESEFTKFEICIYKLLVIQRNFDEIAHVISSDQCFYLI